MGSLTLFSSPLTGEAEGGGDLSALNFACPPEPSDSVPLALARRSDRAPTFVGGWRRWELSALSWVNSQNLITRYKCDKKYLQTQVRKDAHVAQW